jgi:hypothetical protein
MHICRAHVRQLVDCLGAVSVCLRVVSARSWSGDALLCGPRDGHAPRMAFRNCCCMKRQVGGACGLEGTGAFMRLGAWPGACAALFCDIAARAVRAVLRCRLQRSSVMGHRIPERPAWGRLPIIAMAL